jgi:hypothetical protein
MPEAEDLVTDNAMPTTLPLDQDSGEICHGMELVPACPPPSCSGTPTYYQQFNTSYSQTTFTALSEYIELHRRTIQQKEMALRTLDEETRQMRESLEQARVEFGKVCGDISRLVQPYAHC